MRNLRHNEIVTFNQNGRNMEGSKIGTAIDLFYSKHLTKFFIAALELR